MSTAVTLHKHYILIKHKSKQTSIDLSIDDHYKAMKQVYEHIQKNKYNELSFLYIILKRRGNNANNLVWVDKDKITLFYNYKEFTFQVSELYPILKEYFDLKRPEYLETSFLIMYMMIVGFLWLHFSLENKY